MRYIAVLALVLSGCSSKIVKNASGWSEEGQNGVGMTVEWIKLKGNRVDVSLLGSNRYPFEIVVPENSIQAFLDGQGSINPRTNPRMISAPGTRRQGIFTFQFDREVKSAKELTFKIAYIYKGQQTTVAVKDGYGVANTYSSGSATRIGRDVAVGSGSSDTYISTKSVAYEKLSFKEGDRLPPVVVTVDPGSK